MNIKQNNHHKPHTVTHCQQCERRLPTRCRHRECAGCRKAAQGRLYSGWPFHDGGCRCQSCLTNIQCNVAGIREMGRKMGHYQ